MGIGLYQDFNGGYVFNSNWTANANHGPFFLHARSAGNAGGFSLNSIVMDIAEV